MYKLIIKLLFLYTLLFLHASTVNAQQVEMADGLRANGKIYVVVAVLLTLFIFLLIYLVGIDRKITKLEKEDKKQ